jgi:2-polyprenyl-6-methoxyphenol hydroxylase-like FAD-dependent oxidoreductase
VSALEPDRPLGRVVVAGAGVAGLATGAALAGRCEELVLVEPDWIPASPAERRGVPQSRQLHNLLGRAQRHLEELFPGFTDGLDSIGAARAPIATATHVFELGVRMPERDLGMELWSATRPAVEWLCRELLPAPEVVWLEGSRVTGLRFSDGPGGQAVAGVEVAGGADRLLDADLVIDASGAGTRAASWLQSAGATPPARLEDDVEQWYVSAVLERPAAWRTRPDFWLTFPDPPSTRGALLSPLGTEHWYLSVSGRGGDPVPGDHQQMLEHVTSLPDVAIAEVLEGAGPRTEPHLYRRPTAVWRRYDRRRGSPAGFLPIGDALGALNPLLGQGISVATWQASLLASAADSEPTVAALTARYLQDAAEPVRWAWQLGQLERTEPSEGAPRLDPAAWQRVVDAARSDPEVHRRYVRVWHLLEPAAALRDIADSVDA